MYELRPGLLLTERSLENPYPAYKLLREEAPVYWDPTLKSWILTRYSNVKAALRDVRLSANRMPQLLELCPEYLRVELAPLFDFLGRWMVWSDPPSHTFLRGETHHSLSPKIITGLSSNIQEITKELIIKLSRREYFDVLDDFANELSLSIILMVLDIDLKDREILKEWMDDIMNFISAADIQREISIKAKESSMMFIDYAGKLISKATNSNGQSHLTFIDSLISRNSSICNEDIAAILAQVISGGYEPVRHIIGNSILALLSNPSQMDILVKFPETIDSALDELLRYDTPFLWVTRMAKDDIYIDDKLIPSGSSVLLGIAAANHDPAIFTNPEHLDITRDARRHLSFGFDAHYCLGARLSRLVASCAIGSLIRLPDLKLLDDQPKRQPAFGIRGLQSLRVTFRLDDGLPE